MPYEKSAAMQSTAVVALILIPTAYLLWKKSSDNSIVRKQDQIDSLTDFDYKNVKPIVYRPFLVNKHLNMGITKCLKQDWIQIDRGYLDRINERKSTLATQPDKALAVNPVCIPAVSELFDRVIAHLVIRFPTIFKQKGSKFENLVTHKIYDLDETRRESRSMQRMLAENVEEDFYIMCPDKEGIFSLQGFVSCFPGGFLTLGKLGQSMSEIHGGVPGLNDSIGKGIARFMASMRGGSIVQRWNWSFQFNGPELFRTGGNNFYPKEGEVVGELSEDQDLDQCLLRIERQTLVCLPESKSIVFCIRQYLTPIQEIKAEGNGQVLIEAIESMPVKLGYYKKRPFWERDVCNFLRDEPKVK